MKFDIKWSRWALGFDYTPWDLSEWHWKDPTKNMKTETFFRKLKLYIGPVRITTEQAIQKCSRRLSFDKKA